MNKTKQKTIPEKHTEFLPQFVRDYLERKGFDLSKLSEINYNPHTRSSFVFFYHKMSKDICLEIDLEKSQEMYVLNTNDEVLDYFKKQLKKTFEKHKDFLIMQRFSENRSK